MRTTRCRPARAAPTVSQRKLPISATVTSSRTSKPTFVGPELERLVLVVHPELGGADADHGVLLVSGPVAVDATNLGSALSAASSPIVLFAGRP